MRLNIDNPPLSMSVVSKQLLGRKSVLSKGYVVTHMVKRRVHEGESQRPKEKEPKVRGFKLLPLGYPISP